MKPFMLSVVRCDWSGLTKVASFALDLCALSSFVDMHHARHRVSVAAPLSGAVDGLGMIRS
jgi:hypothetical protein